jgi:hypothetical protein
MPGNAHGKRAEERDLQELELLRLVRETGNVTLACRQLGVDRSMYYRAQRRRRAEDGLRARSPLAKPLALENKVIALCLEYPDWGCDRLAWYLSLKGDAISSPTVQKILVRHGLGRKEQRRVAAALLEEEGVRGAFDVP